MAKDSSFDVVSQVDIQEMDNAVNQTKKEMLTRPKRRLPSVTISAAATPALSWKKNALNLPPKTSTN